MSHEFDKQNWQAEQAARDAHFDKEREKHRKARERSARNAQRKLERLRRSLGESGDLSDWEDEFSESVTERLDKYGSAFHDLQKGRPGDALSFAQKRVVAALNKKAKDQRKAKRAAARGEVGDEEAQKYPKKRSSFGWKKKSKFTPRVRQLDEDFDDTDTPPQRRAEPFIPRFSNSRPEPLKEDVQAKIKPSSPEDTKRPFLRLVSTTTEGTAQDLRKLG